MTSRMRRRLLAATLAAPFARRASAQPLTCGTQTPRQTEGPFFTPDSPRRTSLVEKGAKERFVLEGLVLTPQCRPVANALVDLWHADEQGEYDNRGFRYRGHTFTDAEGRYRFETIVAGLYPGRTRHYHVKVQAPKRRILTTQLYFPGEPGNARDGIHRPELEMKVDKDTGRFDFVVDA
ncbi:MAG TPA: intradiol ring-cleavage dioxygenase [Burkholderiales bacterium]|nr:intradiol ring-cleavage dioxygenase [Burkholderiales bacterium]